MDRSPLLSRRQFLSSTTVAGASALGLELSSAEGSHSPGDFIDTNVNLSRWPGRRLHGDETAALLALLGERGVTQAWAGSFDGLLHKNLAAVNARLAEECRLHGSGRLMAFGSINPKLPDWEDDVRRCAEEHGMPGIRLHPNYHGYELTEPRLARLLRLSAERRLIVQLALKMEDERMMHPLLRVDPVDPAPLLDLVRKTPGLRLVLLNALGLVRGTALVELVTAGDIYVEIAMLEGIGGVAKLIEQIPPHRLLFGSHAPFFYFDSACLKLKESPLSPEQSRAIRCENARRLLESSRNN